MVAPLEEEPELLTPEPSLLPHNSMVLTSVYLSIFDTHCQVFFQKPYQLSTSPPGEKAYSSLTELLKTKHHPGRLGRREWQKSN